jgi:hypothetical protein
MRAGWIIMLLLLCTNLPFTSGQPANNIFAYVVYMFPMLAMLVYTRHPPPDLFSVPAQRSAPQFGPLANPALLPPS